GPPAHFSVACCLQFVTLHTSLHHFVFAVRRPALGRFTGLLGLATMLIVAYALSTNRRAIRWRTVFWGLGLQLFFAVLVIKWPYGQIALHAGSQAVTSMLGHSADGSSMVFGRFGM